MNQANKNHAVFILSHGRPDNVITYNRLRAHGYTGRIYIIVDDEDKTIDKYKQNFGDQVIVFSKSDYSGKFDIMDNLGGNKVIVYARNACYDIARSLGLDYFFEYEDDYTYFWFRYPDGDQLGSKKITNLDAVFLAMIDCLDKTKVETISLAQGGDYIGGVGSFNGSNYKRKSMNSFVFKVNKNPSDDLMFIGRMNDDVNTYLSKGKVGSLFFQVADACLVQKVTQSNQGGNTEAYKDFGTYVKSFYSVMAEPSCCAISVIGTAHSRIHHRINWTYAVPKIIRQEHKK